MSVSVSSVTTTTAAAAAAGDAGYMTSSTVPPTSLSLKFRHYLTWFSDECPEGGYKYLVVFGSWLGFIAYSSLYTNSLFLLPIADDYEVGRSAASIASDLALAFVSIGGLFSGQFALYYGVRQITLISAVMVVVGTLLSAAINSFALTTIMLGVVNGLGYAGRYMCISNPSLKEHIVAI